MSFKVAFIGAGSIGFTRGLLADLLTVPEFKEIEIAFTDINPENLRMVTELCQRDIDENGLKIKIHATLDRREAVSYTHLDVYKRQDCGFHCFVPYGIKRILFLCKSFL